MSCRLCNLQCVAQHGRARFRNLQIKLRRWGAGWRTGEPRQQRVGQGARAVGAASGQSLGQGEIVPGRRRAVFDGVCPGEDDRPATPLLGMHVREDAVGWTAYGQAVVTDRYLEARLDHATVDLDRSAGIPRKAVADDIVECLGDHDPDLKARLFVAADVSAESRNLLGGIRYPFGLR